MGSGKRVAVLLLVGMLLVGVLAPVGAGAQSSAAGDGLVSGVRVWSDGPGVLRVAWGAASPVPSDYRVRWASQGEGYKSWSDLSGNAFPESSSLVLEGLDADRVYRVQVRARYYDGQGKRLWSGPWSDVGAGRPSGGDVAGTVLAGTVSWGSGVSGVSEYVGYSRAVRPGAPDRAGGFEMRFWDDEVVHRRSELFALAQIQGLVAGGPAAGLDHPVVLTMDLEVDLSSGFMLEVGDVVYDSAEAVNPQGDAGGYRYWMWGSPCVRWQAGDEAEFRIVASDPGGLAQDGPAGGSLESLGVAGATLDSPFDPGVLDHFATADPGATRVEISAAAAQPGACATQISPRDADGDASNGHQVDLAGAETVVSVSVTAADGSVVRTYTLTVSRAVLSGDATLGGLAVVGAALEGQFDPDVSQYTAQAAAHTARVTVAAEAADAGASVEISPRDADGDASNGHQVDLAAARAAGGEASTTVEVSVLAADGVSRSVYSVAVSRAGASGFERVAGRDVDLRGSGVAVPSGMWSDGSTVWMGDLVYDQSSEDPAAYRVAAVDAGSGGLLAGGGLWLAGVLGTHGRAADVWSDGDTLWVLANDGRLVAFGLADGQRRAGSDIASVRSSGSFFGLWSDGEVLWTGRNSPVSSSGAAPEVTVLAVDLASGRRLAGRDIAIVSGLSGAAGKAHGLWSDGITMWVLFGDAGAALAFDVASTQRRPSLDLGFFARDGISEPRALWSDGTLIWIGDYPISYSFATNTFTGLSRLVAYYLPTQAALSSLSVAGTSGDIGTFSVAGTSGDQISIGTFSAWDTRYRASVLSGIDTVTVDAAAYHPDATFEITPGDADPDTAGHQIRLNTGANTVTVLTGTPSHTVAYTIDIHRPPPALTALELTHTTLTPRLVAETSHYNGIATVGTQQVTVTAASDDPGARVQITPSDTDPDADGHQIDLDVGDNAITVTVTAADGATARIYQVTVTRPPLPTLAALELTDTTLTPQLVAETSHYRGIATAGTQQVTVTAVSGDPGAIVEVAPGDADADAGGHQVDLDVGDNAITVTVTAADGATARVYQVTVTRPPPPTLAVLELTHTTLTPRLVAETSHYNGIATAGTEQVTVTAVSDDPGARVQITPPDADPDAGGHQIDLDVGDNAITVTVTAADGATARVYEVTVTRPPPPTLAVLELTHTTLTPQLVAETSHYSGIATAGANHVTVTAVSGDPGAIVEVAPGDADADADGHQVALDVGDNAVTVTVTAADGATARVYQVTVTRPPPPALAVLELTDTTLAPRLVAETSHYSGVATVGAEQVTVTAVSGDPGAIVEVAPGDADADADGHQVALDVGDNAVTVTVTAADGATARVYQVTVTRPPPPTLTALELTDTTLAPRLVADVSHYTAAVTAGAERVTVTAVSGDPGAIVEVAPGDADADADGHQVDVGSGDVVVTVTVTAADGVTVRVYTVAIGRDIPPAAAGRVALSGVDVEFSPTQSRYDSTVPRHLTSTSIEMAPSGASTLEGFSFTAGDTHVTPIGDDGRVTLTAGRDTLVAVRAASPGHLRERLYTFRLRPPQDSNSANGARSVGTRGIPTVSAAANSALRDTRNGETALLSALSVSTGALDPAFASAVTEYTLSVPHGTDHLTVTPTPPTGATVTYLPAADADPDTGGHQFALNPTQGGQPSQTAVMVIVTHGNNVNRYTITVTRNPASTHEQTGTDYAGDTTTAGRIGINEFLKGQINTGGDVDWYKIDLKAGILSFFYMIGDRGDVYNSTGTLKEAWITGIYKSDGTQAATPHTTNECHQAGSFYGFEPSFDYLTRSGYRLIRCGPTFWETRGSMVYFVPETDGLYYIGVASRSTSNTGTYTLIQREFSTADGLYYIDSESKTESDTLIHRAYSTGDLAAHHGFYGAYPNAYGQLTVGETTASFLEFPRDRDNFQVELTAGRRYRFVGSRASDVMGRSLRIKPGWRNTPFAVEDVLNWGPYWRCRGPREIGYRASIVLGDIWRVSTNESDETVYHPVGTEALMCVLFVEFTAPVTGTYIIQVYSYDDDGASGWGGYKVTVTDTTDD